MLNPRCPNCSFKLVLLSYRPKYKCAKCGRLFLQKDIENKSFRQWNEKQRELDNHNLKLEHSKRNVVIGERRIFRGFRLLFKEKKQKIRLSEEEKKRKRKMYDSEYYYKNREKRTLQKRLWRQRNKEHHNEWKKQHRIKEIDKIRLQDRTHYWRRRQKVLAQQRLEFNDSEPSTYDLNDSFSTFGLSNLLFWCTRCYHGSGQRRQ